MHLRLASIEDAEMLRAWRNDAATRAASHNTALVSRAEHEKWLADTLAYPNRQLFIAEEDRQAVGTVRADVAGGVTELSWTVAPAARGRGVGGRIVALAAQHIAGPLRAEVKAGNEASSRIAERAGLRFAYEKGGVRHYTREMQHTIYINGRAVGQGHPTYIIAEMSANHGQDIEQAVKIITAAKDAGADAVKLQTYTPDTITIDCDAEPFRIKGTLWDERLLYDLYGEAYTPWEWHGRLQEVAQDLGLDFFSTPFDDTAVDFLENLNVPVHKVASFENVDLPLLRKIAATGKPVIMSTGMATLAEIDEAVTTLRAAGNTQLALLKCTSAYPAPASEMNLRTIPHLSAAFGVPVGLSDHTMGWAAPVAAVSLGACIIEKHFTLSRAAPGPDSAFSLEPEEFKALVAAVRLAEQALGQVNYGVSDKEQASRAFRRSLFVVQDVEAGEEFTPNNVRSIRPGHGLHTRHLEQVIGRRAAHQITRGTPLQWKHLA